MKHNILTIMSIKILAAVLKSLTRKTWKWHFVHSIWLRNGNLRTFFCKNKCTTAPLVAKILIFVKKLFLFISRVNNEVIELRCLYNTLRAGLFQARVWEPGSRFQEFPGNCDFFNFPYLCFFKQKFSVIFSMVMLRHEVKNVLLKFIFGSRTKKVCTMQKCLVGYCDDIIPFV